MPTPWPMEQTAWAKMRWWGFRCDAIVILISALLRHAWDEPKSVSLLTPEASAGPFPRNFMTTKQPYTPPEDSLFSSPHSPPSNCKLVHVNYLSRHGSRHSNKLNSTQDLIDALEAAGSAFLTGFLLQSTT